MLIVDSHLLIIITNTFITVSITKIRLVCLVFYTYSRLSALTLYALSFSTECFGSN